MTPAPMLIGYARVSKADGSQNLDLQVDALREAGVDAGRIYSDLASGKSDARPGLDACLKALQPGNTLVVWKLDRLGRDLRGLVNLVHDLEARGIGLKVLAGAGAAIDTTSPAGRMMFNMFAVLAEYERELIAERTRAGLAAARARGRKGGRKPLMTPAKIRLAAGAMKHRDTMVEDLCEQLGVSSQTLYRYVSPDGELRPDAERMLGKAPDGGARARRQVAGKAAARVGVVRTSPEPATGAPERRDGAPPTSTGAAGRAGRAPR